jgi:NDP-sugar pyrophosphorylase family protein
MRAMVLAAGLGTRLRPLTDDRPKALVEINGRTLLEIALLRLRSAGIRDVVVNVYHFADMIVDYLRSSGNFGMRVEISREEVLLDTGGGLKKAAWFFLGDSVDPDEPFIVHNVDVLSTIDLGRMVEFHVESRALATLAVQERVSSRHLLFDNRLRLCGRQTGKEPALLVRDCQQERQWAFCGIHVISPRLLAMLSQEGPFSIITEYLRLAARGEEISAFRADEYYWRDLGRPGNVAQAASDLREGVIVQEGPL